MVKRSSGFWAKSEQFFFGLTGPSIAMECVRSEMTHLRELKALLKVVEI